MAHRRKKKTDSVLKVAARKILFARKWRYQLANNKRCSGEKSVVFVAGAQRSGTNMLMDVLERSLETRVLHESDPLAFQNYEMRPRPEIHRLVKASRACRVIIKALCESQQIPDLLAEFGPAKAIWVVRHFDDVANSMNVSFPNQKNFMLQLADDPMIGGWRTAGMSPETYELLLPRIDPGMTAATAAALQWFMRNRLYFELGLHERKDVLLVAYEHLVQDPSQAFDRITRFIGVAPSRFMVRLVHPRSVRKHPSPDISPQAREICQGLWDRFQSNLSHCLD